MRVMTSAMAQAWVEYLARQLNTAASIPLLEQFMQHAREELQALEEYDLLDYDEATEVIETFKQAYADAKKRLEMLNQVKAFSDEPQPKACFHKHKRTGTGVFFNSQRVLRCNTCGNWQDIREVIQ